MKKIIYLIGLILLCSVSCKKDDPEPEAKRQIIYDTTKVIDRHVDSIYHHFYDTSRHNVYDTLRTFDTLTLTVYDTVRVPIISDHSWIIYIHNNGTDDVDTVEIKNGTYTNLKSDLTRYGYDLVKWSTSPTDGSDYTPGDSYYVDKDITLYAIWQSRDGLRSNELYDFLSKQEDGSTVDVKIIDLLPNYDEIKRALDKFWKVNVNLDLGEAIKVVTFHSPLNYCTNVVSLIAPSNVEDFYMSSLNGLTSLVLPYGVKKVFLENCEKLESIEIPNSVNEFRISGLGLKSISIPNSVTTIEYISSCPSLTEITIPESVESMGLVFDYCTNLKIVKHSLKDCFGFSFSNCKSLTSITIPEVRTGITISPFAFNGCDNLTSLYLANTTPPSLSEGWISYGGTIYVPSSAVNAYKTADGWKDHSDQIVGY